MFAERACAVVLVFCVPLGCFVFLRALPIGLLVLGYLRAENPTGIRLLSSPLDCRRIPCLGASISLFLQPGFRRYRVFLVIGGIASFWCVIRALPNWSSGVSLLACDVSYGFSPTRFAVGLRLEHTCLFWTSFARLVSHRYCVIFFDWRISNSLQTGFSCLVDPFRRPFCDTACASVVSEL